MASGATSDLKRVMVIDDDALTHAHIRDVLEPEGYGVVGARSAKEALGLLFDGADPSLVLLDFMMPEVTGQELFGVMQHYDRLATIPVVGITADPTACL